MKKTPTVSMESSDAKKKNVNEYPPPPFEEFLASSMPVKRKALKAKIMQPLQR
jgi:hypothetical protein